MIVLTWIIALTLSFGMLVIQISKIVIKHADKFELPDNIKDQANLILDLFGTMNLGAKIGFLFLVSGSMLADVASAVINFPFEYKRGSKKYETH
ncbi:hypothetical protein AAGG74_15450 [Bacillus mexicanus]|uniref:hypothetical protein n=1 Tax=Bacillus mexicanus TaxID=2834415 RepID=UPI003D1CDB05